jgi:hypothetical protein
MLDEDMRPVEEDSHVITQLWRLSSEKVKSNDPLCPRLETHHAVQSGMRVKFAWTVGNRNRTRAHYLVFTINTPETIPLHHLFCKHRHWAIVNTWTLHPSTPSLPFSPGKIGYANACIYVQFFVLFGKTLLFPLFLPPSPPPPQLVKIFCCNTS